MRISNGMSWKSHLCGLAVLGLLTWAANVPAENERGTTVSRQGAAAKRTYAPGDLHVEKSRVFIRVGKTGLGHEHGVLGQLKSGTLHLSPESDTGTIVFDMRSFNADSDIARKYVGLTGSTDESTRSQVNTNMLGPGVLDVKKFPTATFEIKRITPISEKSSRGLRQLRLNGDFTLHGVTNKVDIVADVDEKGAWSHVRGQFSILQSDYGITPFSKAFGAVGVADQLQIWGDFWVANEPPTERATGR